MRNLVVVAHPDDEVIWMGGTILRHADWEWHVLALCRADDSDREPRFHASASELGVSGYISDLDDSPTLSPLSEDLTEIKDRVRTLPIGDLDMVFTHGPAGEYTFHARHVQAHKAVEDMISTEELSGTLVVFAYQDFRGATRPRPAGDAQITITLSPDEFERKQRLLRGIYNFGPGTFEYESAGPVEAFNVPGGNETTLANVRNALEAESCEY